MTCLFRHEFGSDKNKKGGKLYSVFFSTMNIKLNAKNIIIFNCTKYSPLKNIVFKQLCSFSDVDMVNVSFVLF